MPALGQRFRAAREARQLTLSEVAEQVRIRAIYLAAIEDEDWNAIGAAVYIRGFMRTYARFLGLDPEEVVAEFTRIDVAREAASPSRSEAAQFAYSPERRGAWPWLIWVAAGVAILLIAFVVYNEITLRKHTGQLAAIATSAPVVTPSAAPSIRARTPSPAPIPTVSAPLVLRLTGPCWISVVSDGRVIAQGTYPAGTAKAFSGRTVTVIVGNAAAAEVTVNGRALGRMGAKGQVVQRTFTLSAEQ